MNNILKKLEKIKYHFQHMRNNKYFIDDINLHFKEIKKLSGEIKDIIFDQQKNKIINESIDYPLLEVEEFDMSFIIELANLLDKWDYEESCANIEGKDWNPVVFQTAWGRKAHEIEKFIDMNTDYSSSSKEETYKKIDVAEDILRKLVNERGFSNDEGDNFFTNVYKDSMYVENTGITLTADESKYLSSLLEDEEDLKERRKKRDIQLQKNREDTEKYVEEISKEHERASTNSSISKDKLLKTLITLYFVDLNYANLSFMEEPNQKYSLTGKFKSDTFKLDSIEIDKDVYETLLDITTELDSYKYEDIIRKIKMLNPDIEKDLEEKYKISQENKIDVNEIDLSTIKF